MDPRHGALSGQWQQLEFLLCDGLEALHSEAAVTETLRVTERCLDFLRRLEEHAARLNIRRGTLSRLILPFTPETDAGYQANSAVTEPLGSRELNGLIPDDERRELVSNAVALRRLIRVKIADCADVDQARDSLTLLYHFIRDLQRAAAEEHVSTIAIFREL